MAEEKYNLRNPAVKRILQEFKEMQSNPSDDFMSLPLEENIFEWQFAIRGPADTEFDGGIYHGRIQLPSEYPLQPPSFMLLTPNGRFEVQTKICLSISNHHPEHWQPSWSGGSRRQSSSLTLLSLLPYISLYDGVRTALVALIAFMPTSPNGALGSLEYKAEERRALAVKSQLAPPKFGTFERQKLINEIHEYMLSKAESKGPLVPEPTLMQASEEHHKTNNGELESTSSGDGELESSSQIQIDVAAANNGDTEVVEVVEELSNTHSTADISSTDSRNSVHQGAGVRTQKPASDWLFTWAAVGLTIAIVVLLLKKFLQSGQHGTVFMDGS